MSDLFTNFGAFFLNESSNVWQWEKSSDMWFISKVQANPMIVTPSCSSFESYSGYSDALVNVVSITVNYSQLFFISILWIHLMNFTNGNEQVSMKSRLLLDLIHDQLSSLNTFFERLLFQYVVLGCKILKSKCKVGFRKPKQSLILHPLFSALLDFLKLIRLFFLLFFCQFAMC